ncbi:DUF6161 domain-containing protein [Rhizobium sp. TRM95111]|uniref:DUF6161 domain-containing protein n=1 Tax=Rhizobium alarense TaxID=2846851 RepID=UPI001F3985D2|nr:DUF6161 domain-containing protein [Rhizobium alarense]MCF3642989.1 DUF6161 domain-containing protein [Rhizobium alarense]
MNEFSIPFPAHQMSEQERFQLYAASALYTSSKLAFSIKTSFQDSFSEQMASVQGALENYRAEFEADRERHRGELNALSAAAAELNQNVASTADDLDAAIHRLKNFETTIREEMKLDRARLTWQKRFEESRGAFVMACGLLALFLGVTIGTALVYGLPIITSLAAVEQQSGAANDSIALALTHQFGRLIVFSVPVLVYLWILRAVMRYFMRSMLLMDDARQRQTMLDTYFLLSENGRADERDRPMILWALFRQTPGHGTDGVEPPDFTEVINAGMKRGGPAE